MAPSSPIVVSKIEPPTGTQRAGADLVGRVPSGARYVAIVAPPGYGKTLLARELHAAAAPGTSAWLSVDLLDRLPYAFWSHLVASLQRTTAVVDDEPLALLAERSPSDLTFVASLSEQIRRAPDPLLLVLDDVDRISDPDVLAGLERLGEWTDGRLRLVMTGRIDPELPLARWRAQGSLVELRQDDLRFDRAASHRFVAAFAPGLLGPDEIDALHDRVEGWPVALQVALIVAREASDPSAAARRIAGTDRLLADYLTGEVLDSLTPEEREVALDLSVLDWFDLELCDELLGSTSVPVARRLRDRQIPLIELAGQGAFRFHSLVRELLESELGWRDPERRRALHRRAGESLLRRNDRLAAVRHLVEAGDLERASEVMAAPALALVDSGRIDELRLALAQMPADAEIHGAERVIDFALAQVPTGRRDEFERWAERARAIAPSDELVASRRRLLLISECSLFGRTAEARSLLDDEEHRTRRDDAWFWDARRAPVLARIGHLLDLDGQDERIETLSRSSAPPPVIRTLVPALRALLALQRGDLAGALRDESSSVEAVELLSSDSHPAAFEALLASGWCAVATGAFDQAHDLADRLFAHPFSAFPVFHLQAASLAVERLVRSGSAGEAVTLLRQIDARDLTGESVRSRFELAMGRALVGAGWYREACELLRPAASSAGRDLLLAWSAARIGRPDEAHRSLSGSEEWPTHLRIESMLVSALLVDGDERRQRAAAAAELAAESGWVSPLSGHGPDVDELVRRPAGVSPGPSPPRLVDRSAEPTERLTEREMTLLVLLPTHLTYSQMGERLYVSVNTIKSNLKSVYRKLGASNRDEAIRAAAEAGLLSVDP